MPHSIARPSCTDRTMRGRSTESPSSRRRDRFAPASAWASATIANAAAIRSPEASVARRAGVILGTEGH